jgi:diguanylate cyclase
MIDAKCNNLLDSLESGYMIIDKNLVVSFWNKWLVINTQISKNEIIGKSLREFYPDLNYAILSRKIKTALALGSPTFYDANGNTKFIAINRRKITTSALVFMQRQVVISPYLNSKSEALISIYDISELHETKISFTKEIAKVKKLNDKLGADQEIIDKNIMTVKTNLSGKIIEASALFCEFFEFTKERLLGQNSSILKSGDISSIVYKELWTTILSKKSWSGELKNRTSSGLEKWVHIRIIPILDEQGEISLYSAVYHDISNDKLLAQLYVTDPLTKLYNRAHFDGVIDSITQHQRKEEVNFFLALADIDYFKSINDNFGHPVGDEILVLIAKTLTSSLRENDLIARWGGEEFVIMLKNVSEDEAKSIIEKVRINIGDARSEGNVKVTASFGLTKYKVGEAATLTFKRADDALYEAKNGGRDRVVLK